MFDLTRRFAWQQLKEGIFALEINVAVLSGQVTLRHGGVYFFSTTVHFSTAVNDTCDTDSKIKVSICIDSDCSGKTLVHSHFSFTRPQYICMHVIFLLYSSLDAVHGTCDKEFSVTATGLLMLVVSQQRDLMVAILTCMFITVEANRECAPFLQRKLSTYHRKIVNLFRLSSSLHLSVGSIVIRACSEHCDVCICILSHWSHAVNVL